MEDKNTQIRMLSDAGFDTEKIKLALGVTDKEIEQALNAPKNEPSTVMVEKRQSPGPRPQYTEELWNEGKAMREQGVKLFAIAKKQGFSTNFISRMLRRDSYEDVVAFRKADAERRKEYNDRKRTSKQHNAKPNWYNADKKEELSSMLIELRTMNDTLLRIAEALEKKRGLFRK